jgi:hypothetical protein
VASAQTSVRGERFAGEPLGQADHDRRAAGVVVRAVREGRPSGWTVSASTVRKTGREQQRPRAQRVDVERAIATKASVPSTNAATPSVVTTRKKARRAGLVKTQGVRCVST